MKILCFTAAFPSLAPIIAYFKFDMFNRESIKFFMDVTEAACNMRKEEGEGASEVSLLRGTGDVLQSVKSEPRFQSLNKSLHWRFDD